MTPLPSPSPGQMLVPDRPKSMRSIIEDISALNRVSVEAILSRSLKHRVSAARTAAMRECRAQVRKDGKPACSLRQIGRVFGRHHTTVFQACREQGG